MSGKYNENLQRVGFLSLVPGLVRRFGANDREVIRDAGLEPASLADPNTTIPLWNAGLLLQIAAEKTQCPHLGLELGKLIGIESLGPVGAVMRHAPQLGAALGDFAAHQHRNAHGTVVYLLADGNTAYFGYAVYQHQVPGADQICDAAAMAAYRLICELSGSERFPIQCVMLSRRSPSDLTPYQEAFGTLSRFDAPQTAVLFPRDRLSQPIPGADGALHKRLRAELAAVWLAGDLDVLTKLRRVLRTELLTGLTSLQEVSTKLGLSGRTLDRHLQLLGVSFQDVLSETRIEYARQLIANTRLSMGQIATLVGFAEASVFSRAFNQHTGMTPRAWKRSATVSLHAANI